MKDINLFKSQPLNTKVLLATAAIYAFVLPVIEIFQAAYIMGQSADMARVVLYQLMVYTGVPITFIFNGFLLRKIAPVSYTHLDVYKRQVLSRSIEIRLVVVSDL